MTKEEKRQERIKRIESIYFAEIYARFNDKSESNENNETPCYKQGDLQTVHLWASFGCEVLAHYNDVEGKVRYIVFVPFRNEMWYDIFERELS